MIKYHHFGLMTSLPPNGNQIYAYELFLFTRNCLIHIKRYEEKTRLDFSNIKKGIS
jgi:hypothetical protein